MSESLDLPGIGPQSRAMLLAAGITSLSQLRALGSVPAYVMVKHAAKSNPSFSPSLNLLWALEALITGVNWRDIASKHCASLLLALEDFEKNQ